MLTIKIFWIINSTMYNMQLYGNRWSDHQLLLKKMKIVNVKPN